MVFMSILDNSPVKASQHTTAYIKNEVRRNIVLNNWRHSNGYDTYENTSTAEHVGWFERADDEGSQP